jgi:serine/threonine protein kinase
MDLSDRLSKHDEQVGEIVAAFLQAEESGESPDPQVWLQRYPQFVAELAEFFAGQTYFEKLARPFRELTSDAVTLDPANVETPPLPGQKPGTDGPLGNGQPYYGLDPAQQPHELGRLGTYSVVKFLGHGGMGMVFLAQDLKLKRTVALKLLLESLAHDERGAARFQREAETVARFRHPNIVQIYEIGTHRNRPFLVLEYVDGGNLAEHLNGRPQPVREAAELVQIVARAIHYGHEHGVVHRDLKPANILLVSGRGSGATPSVRRGSPDPAETADRKPCSLALHAGETSGQPCGAGSGDPRTVPHESSRDHGGTASTHHSPLSTRQPKITDFGLAKVLDEEGLTQTGELVGTPSYMAPEQTRSRAGVSHAGPAADVYALGAILYEMLTGRPPFRGETVLDTLDQVRELEPVPPSRLRPGIPRDIETICLKCVQKEPGKRYADAASLADDLDRFLRNKPIHARPVSRTERLRKWVRRKPALAGLIVLTIISASAVVGAMLVYNARLQREVLESLRQRERADLRYRQARDTISRMLDRLNDKQLAKVPRLKELSQKQREDAITFYEQTLTEDNVPDREIRYDAAVAYLRAGAAQGTLNRNTHSLSNFRRAMVLLETLFAADPTERRYRDSLAETYLALGNFNYGRIDENHMWRKKLLALCEDTLKLFPGDSTWQYREAVTHNNLGQCYFAEGNLHEAEAHWTRAIAIYQELSTRSLAKSEPGSSTRDARGGIATTSNNLAEILHWTGRLNEADKMYTQAQTVLEHRFHEDPNLDVALALLSVCNNRARLNVEQGKTPAGVEILSRAIEMAEPIAKREPKARANQPLLECYATQAHAYAQLHDEAKARADWQRLVDVAEGMETNLVAADHALGLAHLGQWEQALALVRSKESATLTFWKRALVYAVCSQQAANDHKMPSTARGRRTEQLLNEAVALFRQARSNGELNEGDNVIELRTNGDFAQLRSLPGLMDVIKQVDERPGTTVPR